MRLISMQLCNFRQFYGKTPDIQFAGGDRNITILHGNNGAGKTTLLNAFTWALYEKFSAAFASPEQLVNKRAVREAELREAIDCSVEVAFEHDNRRYRLKRLCRAYRNDFEIEYGRSEATLWFVGDDGRWKLTDKPAEEIIGRILPASLHRYFFFDGERMEQIVREDKRTEIAEATRELLGIESFNRAIRHLKEAGKTLEEELRQIGDTETRRLIKDKQKLETEKEQLLQRQQEIQQELTDQQDIKRTLGSRLLELGGAQVLQDRRASLELQLRSLREQLKQSKEMIQRTLSTKGYLVLLSQTTNPFREMIDGMRKRGELPMGIKQQFVRDLLNQQRCICGAELIEGTPAHSLVQTWMDRSGVVDIEETLIRVGVQVDEIEKQAPEFWEVVDREQDNINQRREELSGVETELEEISEKLRTTPQENIQQLQKRLDTVEAKISELERETGATQQKLTAIESQIEQKVKQIAKHQLNEEKQALAQRRIAAVQDAVSRILEIKNRLDCQFRASLEQRVQEIFSQISFTPYSPQLSDKYELSLVEKTTLFELPVAASTGENQILSLSFIGGIIDRVREWSQSRMHLGPNSSTFPVVMDSPFGSLDEVYRRQVAKSLPQLANQLIVLVTKTQWRGEVEVEMSPKLGKEYVLVYNSPKPDLEEDWIQRNGKRYPLVKRSPNQFEYTEIWEIERLDSVGGQFKV